MGSQKEKTKKEEHRKASHENVINMQEVSCQKDPALGKHIPSISAEEYTYMHSMRTCLNIPTYSGLIKSSVFCSFEIILPGSE